MTSPSDEQGTTAPADPDVAANVETGGATASAASCERCGAPLASRPAWPLLVLPLGVGVLAVGALVLMGDAFSRLERFLVVTALFVAFVLVLNPLARRWLGTSRCTRCGAASRA